jgi:hypothetical protein
MMRRGRLVIWSSVLLVCGALKGAALAQPSAPGAAKAEAATVDPAEEHFRRGNALYKEGKWAEAEGEYEKALALRKTNDVAANLGFAELRQEKWREAAEHFAFAVRSWPITGSAEKKAFALKALEEARGKVVALEVSVSVSGAEVYVDGRRVGVSPLEGEVFVEPGAHVVEAKLVGHEDAKQAVQGPAGSSKRVELTLKRKAEPGSVEGPVGPVKKRSVVPAIVLGGVAVAGAGAAIGMWVVANGKLEDVRGKAEQIRDEGGTCKEGAQVHALCEPMNSARSTGKTLDALVIASSAIAGLSAAGAVVYLAWPAPRAQTKEAGAKLSVAPVVGNGGGVVIRGSF